MVFSKTIFLIDNARDLRRFSSETYPDKLLKNPLNQWVSKVDVHLVFIDLWAMVGETTWIFYWSKIHDD